MAGMMKIFISSIQKYINTINRYHFHLYHPYFFRRDDFIQFNLISQVIAII